MSIHNPKNICNVSSMVVYLNDETSVVPRDRASFADLHERDSSLSW